VTTGANQNTLAGFCFYCGRPLISAAPLSRAKTRALFGGQLTCGPCVYERGRLPWREGGATGGHDLYSRARRAMKDAMQT